MPSRTFTAREEKAIPACKTSKDRLTLLLRTNATHGIKLKPTVSHHLKILWWLRIILNLPCALHGTIKPKSQHICSQHGLMNILSPLLEPTAQTKDFQNTTDSWWCTLSSKSSDGDIQQD